MRKEARMSEERIKSLEQCVLSWIQQNSELRIENRYIKHKYRNEIDKQRKSIMTLQAENKRLRESLEKIEVETMTNIPALDSILNIRDIIKQALGEYYATKTNMAR